MGLVPQLRQALLTNRDVNRFELHNSSPRRQGEGEEGSPEDPVMVYAIPITDTCKEVVDGVVRRTVPRDELVDACGPWIFSREALAAAIEGVADEVRIESMVELCRRGGLHVRVRLA